MNKTKRSNRGQIMIIAALLIAALTLSTALSIHQINLQPQEMQYRPVDEFLMGTTSDMERALTVALAKYSNHVLNPANIDDSKQLMVMWQQSALTAYSHLGFKMKDQFQPHFDCVWGGTFGYSSASANYNIDVDSYGFKGWVGNVYKYVQLKLFTDEIDSTRPGITTLNFSLEQSGVNWNNPLPIPNLPEHPNREFFRIGAYDGTSFSPADDVSLTYLGNGKYSVTFNQHINANTKGVTLQVATPDDKIWVAVQNYNNIGGWKTLYFAGDKRNPDLVPDYLFVNGGEFPYEPPLEGGHLSKGVISIIPSPVIETSTTIKVYVFLRSVPPEAHKDIAVDLSFTYMGSPYEIGSGTVHLDIKDTIIHEYLVNLEVGAKAYVPGFGNNIIPDGSIIQVTLILERYDQSGRCWIWNEGPYLSRVELY